MLRTTVVIFLFNITSVSIGQNLQDSFLNYKKDFYWDSTLYKSEMIYFIERHQDTLYQKSYPITTIEAVLISDNPFVTKNIYYSDSTCYGPFSFVRRDKAIYLHFYNTAQQIILSNLEYSLQTDDTVKYLLDWTNLKCDDSKQNPSTSAKSVYLGDREVSIGNTLFQTYCFLEDNRVYGSHSYHNQREIYFDQKTLIPIKIIYTTYDFESGEKNPFFSIAQIESTSNTRTHYTDEKDRIKYKDDSKIWTTKQREEFFKLCSINKTSYCECLISKLDGFYNYFDLMRSHLMSTISLESGCE